MPDGVEPVRLAAEGDRVVVGGQGSDSRPTMNVMVAGELRSLAVRPDASSPYAALARWRSLALLDARLTAIGGASGGAHANTRWTTWDADLSGDPGRANVIEWPQAFWTFGGWEAGGLVDAVATSQGRFLVGAWTGTTGLDIAVWHEDGRRWARDDSAGTPLVSTPTALAGATAATSTGPGILVTGSVTHLHDGVRRTAAVWRSAIGGSDWDRLDLPDSGAAGEARSAACAPDGCLVAGVVDERYALWWVPPAGTGAPARVGGVPQWPVADRGHVPSPLRRGERLWCPVGTALLVRAAGVWAVHSGPPGGTGTDGAGRSSAGSVPPARTGTGQVGTGQAGTGQVGTGQVGTEQPGAGPVGTETLDAVDAAGTVYLITGTPGTAGTTMGARLWRTEWTDHD